MKEGWAARVPLGWETARTLAVRLECLWGWINGAKMNECDPYSDRHTRFSCEANAITATTLGMFLF